MHTKAIESGPEDVGGHVTRGSAYVKSNQYHQGIADLNKARELDSKHGLAYSNRAIALLATGEYEEAWDDARQAQKLGIQLDIDILKDLRGASRKANR